MLKYFSICLLVYSLFTCTKTLQALPPSWRTGVVAAAELIVPRLTRAVSSLRGSKPLRPIEEAPFERVDPRLAGAVQFLDSSRELFRRRTPAGLESVIHPKKEVIGRDTVRIDLKKKSQPQ